ncbi:MAG TPA: hypothetical protein VJC03_04985, partial [bacterium]|nr:hypothetical protein [bacterium]
SRGHTVIDMGEDEFTRGRPHPMIDFSLRKERIVKEASDREVRAVFFDVVLGYNSHPDPAAELAEAVQRAGKKSAKRHILFCASLTGTADDPQGYTKQKETLMKAGIAVFPSHALMVRHILEVLGKK